MRCRCGEVLSNSLAPNDIQLRVYTDEEWDKILEDDVIESWKIPLPTFDVWKCSECQRIYVYEDGNNIPIKVYILEK